MSLTKRGSVTLASGLSVIAVPTKETGCITVKNAGANGMTNNATEPMSYEERRKCWLKSPKDSRDGAAYGVLTYLLEVEDVSLEQAIQRVIDAFGCDHSELMEIMKRYAKKNNS